MKLLVYITWASGIVGGLLILAGIIGFLIGGNFLGVRHSIYFFHIATSILLFGILSKLLSGCSEKNE
ncbi:MAG: hypothetical protein JXB17_05865 [Bacteroidales bacterium]|nr:hypothetical protein [Bacteroidales bacterium]